MIVEDEVDAPSQATTGVNRTTNSQQEIGAIRNRIVNRLAQAYSLIE